MTDGMMAMLRVLLNFVVAGALLGGLVATLSAPRFLTWDNTPGMGTALCNCADVTRQTAGKLINAQMTGCAVGAGLGLIAGIAFKVMRRKKGEAPTAPPAPTV